MGLSNHQECKVKQGKTRETRSYRGRCGRAVPKSQNGRIRWCNLYMKARGTLDRAEEG